MWKQFLSSYLDYNKKERAGIITLIVIIVILCMLPFFYPLLISRKKYDHSAFEKEITLLKEKQADSSIKYQPDKYADEESPQYYQPSGKNYASQKQLRGELFYFDPNNLDESGWRRLGVKDKTIATIQNYLSKGGKFRKPGDIDKIWGLDDETVQRLMPYV